MTIEPDNTFRGQLSANDPSQATWVQNQVVAKMEAQGYLRSDIFGVQLALEEALTNALRHGNGLDPSKRVQVDYRIESHEVWLAVGDEGNGFCPDEIRDPTQPENVPCEGGRGLFFIRSYMNSVEFNETGNRLTMTKRRSRK